VTHLWRYIGHIMGVQPRWYPETVREAFQLSVAYFVKRADTAGDDGKELIESYLRAFEPKRGTGWRTRTRDEINRRAQIGYARYFLRRGFYRSYDMPNPWPWAFHPVLQIPVNLAIGLGRKSSRRFDAVMDMRSTRPVPLSCSSTVRRRPAALRTRAPAFARWWKRASYCESRCRAFTPPRL
jgi:hypothetical protein